jgi:hypothetical protein
MYREDRRKINAIFEGDNFKIRAKTKVAFTLLDTWHDNACRSTRIDETKSGEIAKFDGFRDSHVDAETAMEAAILLTGQSSLLR